jgi:hypothetical protein
MAGDTRDVDVLPAPPPAREAEHPPAPLYRLSPWGKFFAIVGIIGGFFVLATIPGWFGVRAWGRYTRGEPSSIRGYRAFGVVVVSVLVAYFVVLGVAAAVVASGDSSDASAAVLASPSVETHDPVAVPDGSPCVTTLQMQRGLRVAKEAALEDDLVGNALAVGNTLLAAKHVENMADLYSRLSRIFPPETRTAALAGDIAIHFRKAVSALNLQVLSWARTEAKAASRKYDQMVRAMGREAC